MPVKINYGCGHSAPEGWLNFDASPMVFVQRLPFVGRFLVKSEQRFPENVRYGDVVKGLSVSDGKAQCVYASHVLEHLTRDEFVVALRNTFRMLGSGGIFRLIVPDLRELIATYLEHTAAGKVDANDFFLRSSGLGQETMPRTVVERLRYALGRSNHMWAWDWPSIQNQLQECGFVKSRRCKAGDFGDPVFAEVENPERVAWSVAAEAAKP